MRLLILLLFFAFFGMTAGCDKQKVEKTKEPEYKESPKPDMENISQTEKSIPGEGKNGLQENPQAKPPAPKRKKKGKPSSVHLQQWQALLDRFYEREREINEALSPIFSREKELAIFGKYLPQIYTPSHFEWTLENIKRTLVGDPMFPDCPVEIMKIESETDTRAELFVKVSGEQRMSGKKTAKFYKISLENEKGRWVVDKEEELQQVKFNVTSIYERNVFGHLYLEKVRSMPPPAVRIDSEEHLLETLFQIARYAQNERNKSIAQILPPLVEKLESLTSHRYYEKISRHKEYCEEGIKMEVKQWARLAHPPAVFPMQESDSCWRLFIETFRTQNGEFFRSYPYFLILRKDDQGYKFHMEAAEKIFQLPEPGPLLYNLVDWNFPS